MEKEQVRAVLSVLRVNYPQSFRDYSNETAQMFMDIWAEAFKNDRAEDVVNAVKAIIYTDPRDFAPNIAQVKQKILELRGFNSQMPEEAWEELRRTLRKLPSDIEDEVRLCWEELPKEVQRIYAPRDLIELAFHRTSADLTAYERPRFIQALKNARHQEELRMIESSSGILALTDRSGSAGQLPEPSEEHDD